MNAQEFGKRLREARLAKKMTQEQVARAAGVTRPTISQWENGETEVVGAETLLLISRAVEADPFRLLFGGDSDAVKPLPSDRLSGSWPDLTVDQREALAAEAERTAEQNRRVLEDLGGRPRGMKRE